ncbi:hypothetical protein V1281_005810 [Nitrobacteraceae bacterium AZCC 2161]
MSFTQALDAEIAALETEIEADPRLVKLRELKRVRALYDAPVVAAHPSTFSVGSQHFSSQHFVQSVNRLANAASTAAQLAMEGIPPRTPGRKPSPERVLAMKEAAEFLKGKNEPVKTADIYAHIESLGIPIGGEDPQNNLSAMLNKAPEFQSHGRAGWTLVGGIFG